MNKYLNDNKELMKEKFLTDLVMGTIPLHIVVEEAGSYGINILAKYYAVVRIYIEINQDMDYNQYMNVENIISEITANRDNIIKFKRSLNEIILIFKGDKYSTLEKNCKAICEEIEDKTKKSLSFKVSMSMGGIYERIQGISKSLKDITYFKNNDNISNKYEDILQSEFLKLTEGQKDYLDFDDNLILNALRYEKNENIQKIIDDYFNKLKDKKIN